MILWCLLLQYAWPLKLFIVMPGCNSRLLAPQCPVSQLRLDLWVHWETSFLSFALSRSSDKFLQSLKIKNQVLHDGSGKCFYRFDSCSRETGSKA